MLTWLWRLVVFAFSVLYLNNTPNVIHARIHNEDDTYIIFNTYEYLTFKLI